MTEIIPGGLTINVPDRDLRDRVMGEYMDAWSRMEGLLKACIQELLGIDQARMQAVLAAMMTKQTIDLLDSLSQATLKPEGVKRVGKLCGRLLDRNRRRNSIVHGFWVCHVANPSTGEALWIRTYTPIAYELARLPHTDPKIAGIYSFTVEELSATADHLVPMLTALSELLRELPSLRVEAPLP